MATNRTSRRSLYFWINIIIRWVANGDQDRHRTEPEGHQWLFPFNAWLWHANNWMLKYLLHTKKQNLLSITKFIARLRGDKACQGPINGAVYFKLVRYRQSSVRFIIFCIIVVPSCIVIVPSCIVLVPCFVSLNLSFVLLLLRIVWIENFAGICSIPLNFRTERTKLLRSGPRLYLYSGPNCEKMN